MVSLAVPGANVPGSCFADRPSDEQAALPPIINAAAAMIKTTLSFTEILLFADRFRSLSAT